MISAPRMRSKGLGSSEEFHPKGRQGKPVERRGLGMDLLGGEGILERIL